MHRAWCICLDLGAPHQKGLLWPPPQGRSSLVKSGLAFLPETVVYLTRKA